MDLERILRHLALPDAAIGRHFDAPALRAIEEAIASSERQHGGEIRFAVEASLPLTALWRGQGARERAVEVFSELRVWDTERNTGVLIYLLLADRDVEIVADRGVAAADWEGLCREMERWLGTGDYRGAVLAGIEGAGIRLAPLAPRREGDRNELSDASYVGRQGR